MKTIFQQEFEKQTPTIKNVGSQEYLQTYCSFLEHYIGKMQQVNKPISLDVYDNCNTMHFEDFEEWYNNYGS